MYKLEKLNEKKLAELQKIAQELNILKYNKLNKKDLTYSILDHQAENTKMPEKTNKNQKLNPKKIKNSTEKILKHLPN